METAIRLRFTRNGNQEIEFYIDEDNGEVVITEKGWRVGSKPEHIVLANSEEVNQLIRALKRAIDFVPCK